VAIRKRGSRWTVQVHDPRAPGRKRWIGTFDTQDEAVAAERSATTVGSAELDAETALNGRGDAMERAGGSGSRARLVQLQVRLAEMERRNEELRWFAAAAAHELREPLIAIEGYADLLSERLVDALDDQARQDLQALTRGTTRMRVIVETLLGQARSMRHPLDLGRVELGQLTEECVAILRPEIAARGVRVVVSPLPAVRADGRLLGSVLQNLLSNALRYGAREGGVIRVSAEREKAGWRITVDSEGRPIGPADRSRIFDPFQRGRGERRAEGIGLGLAICRTIVEQHGGTIGVEPIESGNRFLFTLPS
jgi:signal transduction histidine kinase